MSTKSQVAIVATIVMLTGGCSTLEFPGVYKMPIEQGNIITQEMVGQLETGLTETQVEYILGTPLIRDPFTPNRWDYTYLLREQDRKPVRHRLSVFFENGQLARYESTVSPGEHDEALERRRALSEDQDPEEDPVAPPPAHEDAGSPSPTAPAPAPPGPQRPR